MASDRGTLPKSIKPNHYAISLYDLSLCAPWTYQGTVRIDASIHELTEHVILNAHHLKIHEAKIYTEQSKTEQAIQAKDISYDEKAQRATLSFDGKLPTSPKATIDIKFEGTMNNHMAGFYRSKYKPAVQAAPSVPKDEEHHYMFSTQFEACSAREAFPCFDEPNLKATYDVEIEIPEDQLALSNMPEKESRKSDKAGLKVVSFERTPVMSTYLLAWAFGDFEYVEDFTRRKYQCKSLPVRVYTTRGLKEQGRFALEHAHQIVDIFSEVFGIDYPLPKADLLAVHEFSHGAMENWGLVTYRTTAVLFDEANSDQRYKNRVAYVVAHELAHQWFGNLVTMDWWNELWLNEGFATWVGWYATNKLHPDWSVWAQFVADEMGSAYDMDSLRSSHPIDVPVRDALQVDQVFDAISYRKGCSIIRMLSSHLTDEVFLKGVSNYLKAHAYGNAKTDDLWAALSEVSGQDVKKLIDPWILKIGFPVLTVAEEPGQISIKQNRFLSTGDAKPEEDQTVWWTPLNLRKSKDPNAMPAKLALTAKEDTIRDIDGTFYKLNANQTGFYRTNYPPPRLAKLGESRHSLSVEDKIGLISDAASLAMSGEGTTPALLGLLQEFQDESNYLVWSSITSALSTVRSVFGTNPTITSALRSFTLKLVTPAVEKLGWDFPPHEDYLTSQLRPLLLETAGNAGHESTLATAKQKFEAYMSPDPSNPTASAIHPSLRRCVLRLACTADSDAAYPKILQHFLTTTSIDGKETCLAALGRVQSPPLARQFFAFLLSPAVATQDIHTGGAALGANNPAVRSELWECIKDYWDVRPLGEVASAAPLPEAQGTDAGAGGGKVAGGGTHATFREKSGAGRGTVLARFLRVALNKFSDKETGADIEEFFRGKNPAELGCDRDLGVVRDTILARTGYRERDEGVVGEWLGAKGYT